MQWFKKIRIGILALSVTLAMVGQTAFAADPEYHYTVRLYPGNQGTVSTDGISVKSDTAKIAMEGDHVVISDLNYKDEVYIIAQQAATVTDSKYHVKGVRRSGRDNSEATEASFPVGSDRDYVIAYAVSGSLVSYTVNYRDADGNELLASDTYYGNPGERQYVSSRYVDGYQPQAMNMVKTLSRNEAENVFTFEYTPVETVATTPETPETTAPATPAAPAAPEGEEAADAEEDEGEEEAETPDEGEDEGEEEPIGGDTTLPDGDTPLGTQDLDDGEDVPLAKMKLNERPGTVMGYMPFYIAIGSMAALALIAAAVYLKKRRVPAKASIESIKEMVEKETNDEEPKEK